MDREKKLVAESTIGGNLATESLGSQVRLGESETRRWNMDREQLLASIEARHAVRRYLDRTIPDEVRTELNQAVQRCNDTSGLSLQIRYDEPECFSSLMAHYGSFRNVTNYLAVIGQTGSGLDGLGGYYGEQIVLLAQHLGLNSCWVGLSYNKRAARAKLEHDTKLLLVVALGYGESSGRPHKAKPIDKLGAVQGDDAMPDWFRQGLEAVALAPSALNQQKSFFELNGTTVKATTKAGSFTQVDLGIAKYHFEVGAGDANWGWG